MESMNNGKKISVIGMGQMGKRIAELYSSRGFDVMVWNRTPGKANKIQNVKIARNVNDAFQHSSMQIICVYDNNATLEIINQIHDKSILSTNTIINFTTGSPAEAENLETIINEAGGHYINGAIQVAPDQMGLPDTTILMGGDSVAYKKAEDDLKILGGNLKHLGEKAASSCAMDLATLTWLYGSYIGLIYGIKLSEAFGLKLDDFGQIISEIVPGFTAFFRHEVNVVATKNYSVTQSPLEISVSATKRIADTFKSLPLAQEFPQIMSSILSEAGTKYSGAGKEVAIIAKIIDKVKQDS
jgi:3-hydroxyisobutyrate dehydrogenase-like beta-hydroxyacid dehydrogenase